MSKYAALILAALAIPALSPAQEVDPDPPGRVARLSYLGGEVSFQAADGDAPEAAVLNRPVTAGDRIITGAASRSEITLGIAAFRLDEHTDFSVASLDDETAQFEINSGTVAVHVRELLADELIYIYTPGATVALFEPGDYRIEVDPAGTIFVDVRQGAADIDAGGGPVAIRNGQQARLEPGQVTASIRALGPPDAFDDWARTREAQLTGRQTERYVSREVVGYEDLDDYGEWRREPEYGYVWYPRVTVGWAPYRHGHWAWISPWGWTWIDHAPWGFAPFHYGRWAYVRSRWCWVPGPRHHRPFYAPALVAWVGDPYLSVSVSIGSSIGWFPLAPREVYIPHRHFSTHYLHRVNLANTVIVNNTYITNVVNKRVTVRHANRHAPGAYNTRPRHEFDSRRPQREWRTNRDRHEVRERGQIQRERSDQNRNPRVQLARQQNKAPDASLSRQQSLNSRTEKPDVRRPANPTRRLDAGSVRTRPTPRASDRDGVRPTPGRERAESRIAQPSRPSSVRRVERRDFSRERRVESPPSAIPERNRVEQRTNSAPSRQTIRPQQERRAAPTAPAAKPRQEARPPSAGRAVRQDTSRGKDSRPSRK